MICLILDNRSGNKLAGLPINGQQSDSSIPRISAAELIEGASGVSSLCSEHIATQATNSHMKISGRNPATILLNGIRSKIMSNNIPQ
jgi:hypothetical protein